MEVVPDEDFGAQAGSAQGLGQSSAEAALCCLVVQDPSIGARSFVAHTVDLNERRWLALSGVDKEIHELPVSRAGRVEMWINELERIRATQNRTQMMTIVCEPSVQPDGRASLCPPLCQRKPVDLLNQTLTSIGVLYGLRDNHTPCHGLLLVTGKCLGTPLAVIHRRVG